MDCESSLARSASIQLHSRQGSTGAKRISPLSKKLCGGTYQRVETTQIILEGASIKLSITVSDINGKNTCSILEYLLTGKSERKAGFAGNPECDRHRQHQYSGNHLRHWRKYD